MSAQAGDIYHEHGAIVAEGVFIKWCVKQFHGKLIDVASIQRSEIIFEYLLTLCWAV